MIYTKANGTAVPDKRNILHQTWYYNSVGRYCKVKTMYAGYRYVTVYDNVGKAVRYDEYTI